MSLLYFTYDPTAEFDRLFEDAFATRFYPRACAPSNVETRKRQCAPAHAAYSPRLDLIESEETNTVTATFELPGFTSNDITIELHENRLTISGGESSPDTPEDRSYVVRERRTGKFSRTLVLPLGTKFEDVKAKLENGILTVTFPKTLPEQQPTRVPIQ